MEADVLSPQWTVIVGWLSYTQMQHAGFVCPRPAPTAATAGPSAELWVPPTLPAAQTAWLVSCMA